MHRSPSATKGSSLKVALHPYSAATVGIPTSQTPAAYREERPRRYSSAGICSSSFELYARGLGSNTPPGL